MARLAQALVAEMQMATSSCWMVALIGARPRWKRRRYYALLSRWRHGHHHDSSLVARVLRQPLHLRRGKQRPNYPASRVCTVI